MTQSMTELDLVVGSMITTKPEEDREQYEEEKDWLQDVQDLLREEGIEVDLLSNPASEVWEGSIESFYDLYQLRRLAAHMERGDAALEILRDTGADADEVDPLLVEIWDDQTTTRFPHLIKHQGDGGYFLPVEFAEPIWVEGEEEELEEGDLDEDDDNAVSFGSSIRLLHELTELEELFQTHKVPVGGVSNALQVLKAAAQQSVTHKLPIILW
ncbi:MAG: hypothetical protein NVS4B8_02070 [Herpetosiphon sp.]